MITDLFIYIYIFFFIYTIVFNLLIGTLDYQRKLKRNKTHDNLILSILRNQITIDEAV